MKVEERITLLEAAEALGVSEQTTRRWIKSGKLKAYRPGLRYLIPKSAVDDLLGKNPAEPERLSLAWARTASEVEFYRRGIGAPDEDNERLNRLLGELNRFVWRPWRAAIRKKNTAIRGEAQADATASPEPAGQDEFELMRGRRNALRDEVRRRIPAFARIVWKQEGGAVVYWHVPEDEREQYRGKVEEALEGEPYTEEDGEAEARAEREELLHA